MNLSPSDMSERLERQAHDLADLKRKVQQLQQELYKGMSVLNDVDLSASYAKKAIENARGQRGVTIDPSAADGGLRIAGGLVAADTNDYNPLALYQKLTSSDNSIDISKLTVDTVRKVDLKGQTGFSKFRFGFDKPTNNQVKVKAGTLWVGIPGFDFPNGYTTPPNVDTFTVTNAEGSGGYIGWQWEGTFLNVLFSEDEADFIDTEERLAGWFHKWTLVHDDDTNTDIATLVAIGHLGNLKFPGNYAMKPPS